MKTLIMRKTNNQGQNKTFFLFQRYELINPKTKVIDTKNDSREIGRRMAEKVSKKLILRLDI